MILTCVLAGALLLLATLVGSAVTVALAPARADRAFMAAAAPLFGMAVLLAVLDLAELGLALHASAWVVPLAALFAAGYLLWKRALPRPRLGDVAVVLLGIAAGALPTALVGRVTAIALTNDDATYYLAVAERLVSHSWLEHPGDGRGTYCLSEQVLHAWLWRTGVANLTASVIAVARVDGTVAIAVVTSALTGFVAQAAIAVGVALGTPRRPWWPLVLAPTAVALSAAPIFLGWQHLLGELSAFAVFPVGLACLARASAHGGMRRIVPAALLVGAAMNVFADAAPVMFCGVVSVLFLGKVGEMPGRAVRIALAGALAVAVFPMTFWRAAWAAYGTVMVRLPAESRGLFPQRGWLDRTPVDDIATLVGVDPWPPWPAPWPPTPASLVEYAAVTAALVLLTAAIVRGRGRPGLLAAAGAAVVLVATVMIFVSSRYLRDKCLLLEASLAIPAVAWSSFLLPRWKWGIAPFAVWFAGGLAATAWLARPSGFHVVDEPDHDRLSGALALLPPGSLLFLDGFGAPADVIHDEHRAMRAAHLDGLVPIQPGLDGGFFKPICEDPQVRVAPDVGWALHRAGTEAISGGEVVERFGRFTLRKVDLSKDDGVVGAWAPTYGWKRAETEPDGTVFRWGEAVAAGTLRVVTRGWCGRLTGEVRSVDAAGSYSVTVDGTQMVTDKLTPVWATFRTGIFSARDAVPVAIHTFVAAPDEAHTIALRKLAFTPDPSCLAAVARQGEGPRDDIFPDILRATRTYVVGPALGVRCGAVVATVDASGPGELVVAAGSEHRVTTAGQGQVEASSPPVDFRHVSAFSIQRVVNAEAATDWHVLSLRVRSEPCHDEAP